MNIPCIYKLSNASENLIISNNPITLLLSLSCFGELGIEYALWSSTHVVADNILLLSSLTNHLSKLKLDS